MLTRMHVRHETVYRCRCVIRLCAVFLPTACERCFLCLLGMMPSDMNSALEKFRSGEINYRYEGILIKRRYSSVADVDEKRDFSPVISTDVTTFVFFREIRLMTSHTTQPTVSLFRFITFFGKNSKSFVFQAVK